MLEWLTQLTATPYFSLLAWTLGVAALVQCYKRAMKAAKLRHHDLVERTLPLAGPLIGLVSGAAAPHELGVGILVDAGHHSLHVLGGFYGVGVGFVSSGVFRAALEWLPDGFRDALTVADDEGSPDE